VIGRLIAGMAALVTYFCIATVISLAIGVGWLYTSGKLNRDRMIQIAAVLNGIDLSVYHVKLHEKDLTGKEEVSLEEIARQRALAFRNLELREQAVTEGLKRFRFVEQQLAQNQGRYERVRKAFDEEVSQLRSGAVAEGQENVRQILETIKPKQAKEQLLAMYDDGEIDVVVALLGAMPSNKRAKIVSEFKSAEDAEKLAEVLRRLRQGIPLASSIDRAQNQQQPPGSKGT